MLKNLHALMLMLFLSALIPQKTFAQYPYIESFKNATAAGANLGGNALLTSGNADPSGNGYLRLTSNLNSQSGYAFISNSFPSTNGFSTSFEYDTWGGTGADGICFFLFDAAVADQNFVIGSFGGSLGYSAGTSSPNGLSKAYLGVGLDEYGNFSHPAFGAGGTGFVPNSVTLRGAWDDPHGAFYMLKTVPVFTNYGFNIGSGTARAANGTQGFRRAFINIAPDASGVGFDITLKIQHDAVSAPVTIIDHYYYNKPAPANFKFGFAASTGGSNNFHEIRNVNITLPPVLPPQTITFPSITAKTYGAADFDAGATASSGLAVTYASSNQSIATIINNKVHIAGAGTVTITASQPGDATYDNATPVTQTLTVNPAALTVSAANKTKIYGDQNPVLTASYSGFVNGETSASLTALPVISTTATTTSAVGSYPITASGAASNNYQFSYVNGVLAVYPGTQTITFTLAPKTYGDPDFTLNAIASSGLPVTYSSSNPAVAMVDANGLVHILAAGDVTISALQPGNGNYVATTIINQQVTIKKAPLLIIADNLTKAYGSANPALNISYTGFVNGDTNSSLSTQPVSSTTATTTSAPGAYPIAVSGAASTNYAITYQSGLLYVEQNTQQITINTLPAKTYGDADFVLNAAASSGLPLMYSSSDPTIATVDASGNVHIVAAGATTILTTQAGNSNYFPADTVRQILTVNKASVLVTADTKTAVYGSAVPAFTVTYTGFVNGETAAFLTTIPTVSTTATPTAAAGTYPITATDAAAANYNFTYADGVFTLTKAALTIAADDKTRAYGLANPAFTFTYTGFVNGETTSVLTNLPTAATTATTSSAMGTYPITLSAAAADNYQITYLPGNLTVTSATVSSISLAQLSVLENQPAGTVAGTLSGVSLDPNAVYTYSLVSGNGSADNASFTIQGNKILTAASFDFEQKASYSILIRAANQSGLYIDQSFIIQITDVNEAPTLAAIANQLVCSIASAQKIKLTGITPGPETAQSTTISVSSSNPAMFSNLSASPVSGGTASLDYTLISTGTATITVTVKDNGGTANGGVDSFSQTFDLTANALPVAAIAADKSTQITKGQTVTLTASGGSMYNWEHTDGIVGATNTAVIQVRPAQTTTYQVSVNNASGCSSVASITITVADDYSVLQASNILTPNGDGKNDTWVVKNIDLFPEATIVIFDKGGRRLMNVKHYQNDWDGSYQGSPLTEGTYYYVIDLGAGKTALKGFITILRNR